MKVINVSDSELINRSLQGDPIAYGRLIGRYYESIYHLALRILKDPLDAEEVTQDAFWKAYLSLDSLNKHTSFSSWIMRIAMNLAIDKLRGREDVDYVSLEDLPSEEVMVESFEDEILRKELMEEITRAIEGLPEEDRDLLERYLAGESYRELSERYGKSIGSLKMRVKRAKEKVLRRLSGIMIFPWGKIGKMIGGAVMKATTKVAITGAVVMMLAGTGIWMSHRGEEKPVPEVNKVKVERQATVGAPARVTVGNPEPRKKEDELTFEEFNRLLDECFEGENQEGGTIGVGEKYAGDMESPEEENMIVEEQRTEKKEPRIMGYTLEEARQKAAEKALELENMLAQMIELRSEARRLVRSTRNLSLEEKEIINQRAKELERKAIDIFLHRYLADEFIYLILSGDTEAIAPKGWLYKLRLEAGFPVSGKSEGGPPFPNNYVHQPSPLALKYIHNGRR